MFVHNFLIRTFVLSATFDAIKLLLLFFIIICNLIKCIEEYSNVLRTSIIVYLRN